MPFQNIPRSSSAVPPSERRTDTFFPVVGIADVGAMIGSIGTWAWGMWMCGMGMWTCGLGILMPYSSKISFA